MTPANYGAAMLRDASIVCEISDDGSPATTVKVGAGSRLIDALADEPDGAISRAYTAFGAVATLRFHVSGRH